MAERETPRLHKHGKSKTTRIMMATVRHVTAWAGRTNYQAAWFLLSRVRFFIHSSNSRTLYKGIPVNYTRIPWTFWSYYIIFCCSFFLFLVIEYNSLIEVSDLFSFCRWSFKTLFTFRLVYI